MKAEDPLAIAIRDATDTMPPAPIYAVVGNELFTLSAWALRDDVRNTMDTTWSAATP